MFQSSKRTYGPCAGCFPPSGRILSAICRRLEVSRAAHLPPALGWEVPRPPRGTESCRGRHSRCSFRTGEKLTVHVLVGVGRFCCRTHRIQTISFLDSADILELLPARGVGDKLLKLAIGNYCNISSCQVPFQHALSKRKTTGRREKISQAMSPSGLPFLVSFRTSSRT